LDSALLAEPLARIETFFHAKLCSACVSFRFALLCRHLHPHSQGSDRGSRNCSKNSTFEAEADPDFLALIAAALVLWWWL
jgi:hypothetical protein